MNRPLGRPRTIPRGHPSFCNCLGCSRLQWKAAKKKARQAYDPGIVIGILLETYKTGSERRYAREGKRINESKI